MDHRSASIISGKHTADREANPVTPAAMKVYTRVVLWLGLAPNISAQYPELSFLRTTNPYERGHFGLSCSIDNGRAAVCSEELLTNPFEFGSVAMFEENAASEWVRTQLLRLSQAFPTGQSPFANQVEIVGDSMMVLSGGANEAYEFQYVGGQWAAHEALPRPAVPGLDEARSMSYDGLTLISTHPVALNVGGAPGSFVFWERQGNWLPTQIFSAPQLGVDPTSTYAGSTVIVHGDTAAIGAYTNRVNGFNAAGTVFIMRRTNGIWAVEQRIDNPFATQPELYFGGVLALHGDELFIRSAHPGWTNALTVHLLLYRRNALGVWEQVDDVQATAGPGQSINSVGLASQLLYVPPTLFVGASAWRVPGGAFGDPFGGYGAVLAFERCDHYWNQRLVMTTPYEFISAELGGSGLDFDGQTVIAGGQYYTGYANVGTQFPNVPTLEAGIAAVVDYTPLPPGTSLEFGRPACAPATDETTDCPCGTAAAGLGCPNTVGPGARLAAYGGFNQERVPRITVDGLPPHSTTLLAIGAPVLVLPAGNVQSGGVWCIGPPLRRFAGQADAAGVATFDNVATPNFATAFSFYELPFQALYRQPAPAPCGHGWNASSAVLLHLDRY